MTNECEWRKEVDDIGVCGLHILPCRKVMEKGLCEYEHKVSEDDLISRQEAFEAPDCDAKKWIEERGENE